ncbi:hypothetical protein M8C13_09715 [Crossiella sp. SN42]|nr:hypothetical protein [Crossiella sp. SN42]MCO1576031.1 hypothetical protein [Crossiella sp. SN42]
MGVRHGTGSDAGLLMLVSRGLASGVIPAEVRAAVFKALTYLPNLEATPR